MQQLRSMMLAHGDLGQLFRFISTPWNSKLTIGGNNISEYENPGFPSPLIILVEELIGHSKRKVECREAIGAPNRDPRDLKQRNPGRICALITFFR